MTTAPAQCTCTLRQLEQVGCDCGYQAAFYAEEQDYKERRAAKEQEFRDEDSPNSTAQFLIETRGRFAAIDDVTRFLANVNPATPETDVAHAKDVLALLRLETQSDEGAE